MLASHFPNQVPEFGLDELFPCQSNRGGRARSGNHYLVAEYTSGSSREHRGRTDLFIAQHPKQFAETRQFPVQLATEDVIRSVAAGYARSAVEEYELHSLVAGEIMERLPNPVGFVRHDTDRVQDIAGRLDRIPQVGGVGIRPWGA